MGTKSTAPAYDQSAAYQSQLQATQAQAKYGTYGVSSALGNMNVRQNADGTFSLSYDMGENDKLRNSLINQGLSSLNLDPSAAQQAYYNQATSQLIPQFQQDQARLHEQLVNRGITEGSSLYNDQMNKLRQNQNNQLSNIANQSVYEGQNYLATQIGNIGGLAGQYDILAMPTLSGSTGGNFQETYSQKYKDEMDRYNQKVQGRSQMAGTIGSLVGTAIGGYFGGPGGAQAGGAIGGAVGKDVAQ